MKKILTIMLAMLCVLSSAGLAGCNNGSASSEKTDASSSASEVKLADADLGGKTVTIATWLDYNNSEDTSLVSTARREYFAKIEKELNCKLEWKIVDKATLTSQLITTALTGDKFADIAITVMWNTASVLTNKAFHDINSVETVNLEADYYDADKNRLLDINGVQRAASCGLTCTPASETSAVVFNKRILSECGLEDPYALYEKNEWTVSKLREMAKAATKDLDGVSGMTLNDQYGITTLDPDALARNILTANGAYTITKEKGKNFTYNMNDEKVVNTLKYTQDWFCNDGSLFINSNQDTQHAQFSNGRALFYIFQLNYLKEFTEMSDEYGVVPFPRGDEEKSYVGQLNWNTCLMGIPSTVPADELADVGAVFEALAAYSKDDNANRMNEIVGRYLRDEKSAEMLEVISSTGIHTADLVIATPRIEAIYQAHGAALGGVTDITRDISQIIASNKNSFRSALNSVSATLAAE